MHEPRASRHRVRTEPHKTSVEPLGRGSVVRKLGPPPPREATESIQGTSAASSARPATACLRQRQQHITTGPVCGDPQSRTTTQRESSVSDEPSVPTRSASMGPRMTA